MKSKFISLKNYNDLFKKDIEKANKIVQQNTFLKEQIENKFISPQLVAISDDVSGISFVIFYCIIIVEVAAIIGKSNKDKIIRELKKNHFIYHYDKKSDVGYYFYSSNNKLLNSIF
jgi:hypothetical protein